MRATLSHDDARLDGLGRGAAEQRFVTKFHGGQLGGSAGQRLGAELHAGAMIPPRKAPASSKVRRWWRCQVDDEGRRAVGALGAHHLGDAVAPTAVGIEKFIFSPVLRPGPTVSGARP